MGHGNGVIDIIYCTSRSISISRLAYTLLNRAFLSTLRQWRGNYFRTEGARPSAPKSGTRNKVFYPKNKRSLKKEKGLRRIRSVFLLSHKQAFSKKKNGLRQIRSVFLSQKWLRIQVSGGQKSPRGGGQNISRGAAAPLPPTSRAYALRGGLVDSVVFS